MTTSFLEPDEIKALTGRTYKTMQIKALARMGVPFWVNDIGRPVVARAAIEGKASAAPAEKKAWVPRVLKTG